jgi:hypothetical protein
MLQFREKQAQLEIIKVFCEKERNRSCLEKQIPF